MQNTKQVQEAYTQSLELAKVADIKMFFDVDAVSFFELYKWFNNIFDKAIFDAGCGDTLNLPIQTITLDIKDGYYNALYFDWHFGNDSKIRVKLNTTELENFYPLEHLTCPHCKSANLDVNVFCKDCKETT